MPGGDEGEEADNINLDEYKDCLDEEAEQPTNQNKTSNLPEQDSLDDSCNIDDILNLIEQSDIKASQPSDLTPGNQYDTTQNINPILQSDMASHDRSGGGDL